MLQIYQGKEIFFGISLSHTVLLSKYKQTLENLIPIHAIQNVSNVVDDIGLIKYNRAFQLVEPHPALHEAEAVGGSSTKSKQPPTLLPPSRKRGPKRQGGMEKGSCSGGQANPLPASLTCPVGLKQQIWGSGR